MTKKTTSSKKNLVNRIVKLLYLLVSSFLLIILLLFLAVRIDLFGLFGDIPSHRQVENPENDIATEIISSDQILMGKYFSKNRQWARFEDISPNVIKALIATEDERFEDHSGVDLRATLRMIRGIITLNLDGGGSTISMQLAKNLFRMRDEAKYKGPAYEYKPTQIWAEKCKEWIAAPRIEQAYSKKEIITMYLNTVDFGRNAFGIEAAAQTYFGKNAKELNIQESASLVGLLKATSTYDPVSKKEKAKDRRSVVLYQLVKNNFLTKQQTDSIKALPLGVDYNPQNYQSGLAPYFREQIKDEVIRIAEKHDLDIYKDGLKVYTTIDSRLQKYAEKAVHDHMSWLQEKFDANRKDDPWSKKWLMHQVKQVPEYYDLRNEYKDNPDSLKIALNTPTQRRIFTYEGIKDTSISLIDFVRHNKRFLQTGFLSIDAKTGEVKAWVGGVNKKHFSYDHVKQGNRQPGSTFKPIVYATAIKNGYTPCNEIFDGEITINLPDGKIWSPNVKPSNQNITLKECLARSLNNCAGYLIRDIQPENVVNHAAEYGIDKAKLDPVLSLALGTSPVSLYELIQAYTTFVNKGVHQEPIYISRIEDRHGRILYRSKPKESRVLSELEAYKMVTMLRGGVTDPRGTGRSLRTKYKLTEGINQVGGKTGTSQNSSDGWFMGITNSLVSGCWVGGEINSIRFKNNYYGQGAVMALPIFGKYMQSVYKSDIYPHEAFYTPPSLTKEIIYSELRCDQDSLTNGSINIYDTEDDELGGN